MTSPPRSSRAGGDGPRPHEFPFRWRTYMPVLVPTAVSLLLLIAGDRVQWSVVRALRVTVLYPAALIDNTIRDVMFVRSENETLRRDLAIARTRLVAVTGTTVWDTVPPPDAGWRAARVVGRGQSAGGNWNYLTVRPTDADRDTANAPWGEPTVAFTPDGLVGAVVERGWGTATVRSITAPESAVHVLDQRSRVAGVVRAAADVGIGLRLHHVPAQEDVAVGDTLITSGFGLLFPPDLPVGRVIWVDTPEGALVRDVRVEPFVPFARLEYVFLSARRPPW